MRGHRDGALSSYAEVGTYSTFELRECPGPQGERRDANKTGVSVSQLFIAGTKCLTFIT